jgi:glycosyltransferase involved in cell wall biosynthesis
VSAPAPEPGSLGLLRLFVVFHESEALGAGRSVLQCLDGLAELGWTTSGWFPERGPLTDATHGMRAPTISDSRPIAYSARGWRADPGLGPRLARTPGYLRRFRRELLAARPNVVHANTLRVLPEASVARSLGIPVVLHVHELPAAGPKSSLVLRWAARTADVLVAVSNAVAERLAPYAGDTPVLVVRNGVPSSEVERRPEPGVVGTVGTICPTKGTDVFLEAAAIARSRSRDLRFEHVGQGGLDNDVAFARRVEELSAAPGLDGALQMLGPQPAAPALARWEIFVLSSRQDAFPLASLEAMQAGLPVIGSAVGGLPEQIAHGETGVLVAPECPSELADWIVRLHDDPATRARLGEAAAAHVRTAFTVEAQVQGLHRAYLGALNLRYAPPPVRATTLEAL